MINSLKSSFLNTCPKVWADKNILYARTSLSYRILNFFSYSKTVVVDQNKKHVEIRVKSFWFFTSKKYIPFNEIKYVDIERREKSMFGLTQTQGFTETWDVQITRENSSYPENLFNFVGDGGGDGTAAVPLDASGMQYEKALSYVELISKYTGSQLFKKSKIEYNTSAEHYKCLKCGHENTSKTKCFYCGSQEMEKLS